MPNRWERNVDNVLVPKIPATSIKTEAVKVLPSYSRTDDFNYPNTTAAALVYTIEGTLTSVTDGSRVLSGTTAGNAASITTLGASNQVDPTKELRFKCRTKVNTTIDELFGFIGCFETNPTSADPPVEAGDWIGFRVTHTTGGANWFAVTSTDGTTAETPIDTNIALDLLVHDFEFILDGGSAIFKIDGTQVATTSLTLPVATTLVPVVKLVTGNTTAKEFTADVLSVVNSRT